MLSSFVSGEVCVLSGEVSTPFSCVRAAIQNHVFYQFQEIPGDLIIYTDHAGIDNAHIHAGFDGVE